ncbi:MAG: LytTR family DNA-binding domain-containing protein [Steroidobacteraceae bacterium]
MNKPLLSRVLIVDDGALARQRIEELLAEAREVRCVGSVGSGTDAVRAIKELQPDIVFLDVQMPGMSGIDVVREIGVADMPVTVFVTAYDNYALPAFELAAVDYLLKPFTDERFAQALSRAQRQTELRKMDAIAQPLRQLLAGFDSTPVGSAEIFAERLAVEGPGQVQLVPVLDIDYILASGHYAELHSGGKMYLIRERMDQLESRLDPARFCRVHRSAFVQLDRITSLIKGRSGWALSVRCAKRPDRDRHASHGNTLHLRRKAGGSLRRPFPPISHPGRSASYQLRNGR